MSIRLSGTVVQVGEENANVDAQLSAIRASMSTDPLWPLGSTGLDKTQPPSRF
jgi:hypothetical protein